MSWAVLETETQGVHVVPWDDEQDAPAYEHHPSFDCSCRPTAKRDAPLDDPVWNHHEAGWPGSGDRLA